MNHQLVDIHPDAKIGKDVTISAFVSISADVEIGDGTWIGPSVSIMDGARIGKNCKIFPGAVISAIPQDLKFVGEETFVEVGDNTTIREYVTLNRGTQAKGKTKIGANCLLMAYVHVAHDCIIGDNCILVNGVQLAGEVEVGDFAIISGSTLVHQFVRIGGHVMITGGSKVRKDVPPYITAGRDPLAYVGLNSIGLRRRKFDAMTIENMKNAYRIIFAQGNNTATAISLIESELEQTSEIQEIVQFIKESPRGIIKGLDSKK